MHFVGITQHGPKAYTLTVVIDSFIYVTFKYKLLYFYYSVLVIVFVLFLSLLLVRSVQQ